MLLRQPQSCIPLDSRNRSKARTTKAKTLFFTGSLLQLHAHLLLLWHTWSATGFQGLMFLSYCGHFQFIWRQFQSCLSLLCFNATARWKIWLGITSFSWEPTERCTLSIGFTEPTLNETTSTTGLSISVECYKRYCTVTSSTTILKASLKVGNLHFQHQINKERKPSVSMFALSMTTTPRLLAVDSWSNVHL